MTSIAKSVVLAAIVLLPAAAWAQTSDSAYCSALADKYQR